MGGRRSELRQRIGTCIRVRYANSGGDREIMEECEQARADLHDLLAVLEAAEAVVEADDGHGNPVEHSEAVSGPIARLRDALQQLEDGGG